MQPPFICANARSGRKHALWWQQERWFPYRAAGVASMASANWAHHRPRRSRTLDRSPSKTIGQQQYAVLMVAHGMLTRHHTKLTRTFFRHQFAWVHPDFASEAVDFGTENKAEEYRPKAKDLIEGAGDSGQRDQQAVTLDQCWQSDGAIFDF